MAQQINLFNPILLTPKRHFSAAAMLPALGALALGLAALSGWTMMNTRQLRHDLTAADATYRAEKQSVLAALARQPAPRDTAALEQELDRARRALAERRQQLDDLRGGASGSSPTAWLQLLALTAPPPLWLTEVRIAGAQIEIGGATLQPEVLRPWLARLAGDTLAAGQPFASLRVERVATAETPTWTFVAGNAAPAAKEAR